MKATIYIALAFAVAMWLGTMCGHWADRHVKSEIVRGRTAETIIELEAMR